MTYKELEETINKALNKSVDTKWWSNMILSEAAHKAIDDALRKQIEDWKKEL